MTRWRMRYLAAVWVVSLVIACGGSSEDYDEVVFREPPPIANAKPAPPPTALVCPKGTYLTYENFGAAFLSSYCTNCHGSQVPEGQRGGAPPQANFDSATEVQVYRALMLLKTQGDNPTMPPVQPIAKVEREALVEWLNCGAPTVNGDALP